MVQTTKLNNRLWTIKYISSLKKNVWEVILVKHVASVDPYKLNGNLTNLYQQMIILEKIS